MLDGGSGSLQFLRIKCTDRRHLVAHSENVRMKSMINSTHIIGAGEEGVMRDSLERLLTTFYVDQFRHFQDPRAPYFMFMSKSSMIAMGVGGLVRIRGYYDWNGSIPINGFSPYSIPIPVSYTHLRAHETSE